MKSFRLRLCELALALIAPGLAFAANVTEFGAQGDGATDDTAAVQAAIDACAARGEAVVFPAGTFMTGTIQLRSHAAIELTAKAVWKGIGRVDAYPVQHPRGFDGRMISARRAMIYAEDVEDISISGPGMFHGNGENQVFQSGIADSPERPFGLWIVRGRDIRIEGIQMRSSAYWMQNYEECDHVRITGIRVFNHANLNNDGLDLSDCQNVSVSDCEIDSDDDGLCLKSHGPRGTSDVVISNCVLASHAQPFKFGTASVGGFRRITASNLVIRPSAADHVIHPAKLAGGSTGIALLSTDGGTLEDVVIQNVVMDGVHSPIWIKLGDRWAQHRRAGQARGAAGEAEPPRGHAGAVRNVRIAHVIARRCGPLPSSINGYPDHPVENIVLSDMVIETEGGAPAYDQPVPENSGSYPFERMFGPKLPAYGFFVRHVDGVQFRNIQLKTIAADERRAFIFDDATGALDNVEIANAGGPSRAPVLADRDGVIALRGTAQGLGMEIRPNRPPAP